MKKLFLFLCLSLNVFALGETKLLLQSISQYAMVVGDGESSKSFVFVDPLCPFSKEFIKTITTNKTLQAKTTYYVFFYRLPKKDSARLIQHIYESKNPLETMKSVMVQEEAIYFEETKNTSNALEMIEAIAKVAKELNVKVRPYLLKFEKGSNYCDVSHGTAYCEQEDCPHG